MNITDNNHSNLAIIFRRDDVAGSSSAAAKKRHSSLSDILKPKKPQRTKKTKPRSKNDNEDDVVFPRPCTECGKKFFSKKALYGHMRCHPERRWRGINPPPAVVADEYEIATCLLLLAGGDKSDVVVFECSSCKRVFGSHQALGGHRASHKNVKGCFARCTDEWACGPNSKAHGLLGFDLNLPAVDHGGDDDECCYSSSLSISTCDYLDLRLGL